MASVLTVSGLRAPVDSTLKKYLLGTLFGSNVASCSFSGNSTARRPRALIKGRNQLRSPYRCARSVAILPVQDRSCDEGCCQDRTRMTRPANEERVSQPHRTPAGFTRTQVGIHLACSLPKPFLACAFKRSSWYCRSLTMRISNERT